MARLRGGSRIFGNLTVDGLLIGGNANSVQVFATGSNQPYTVPTNLKRAIVIATGGGGGGGGASAADNAAGSGGGGGAAGGTAIRIYTAAEIGSNPSYTIGAGGNGGSAAGGAGTAGGNTIFTPSGGGTVLTANGGGFGNGQVTAPPIGSRGAGGVGGTATGGTLNIQGGDGSDGAGDDAAEISFGGRSGSSFWGGGGRGASAQGAESTAGLIGKAYGSGGGGGAVIDTTTGAVGGAGLGGVIFVLEFT